MSSYVFEYNEYIWDVLYYLIMKRFNFNMESIRQRREFFQKPIVMNLEYEIQMRNCFKKQKSSDKKFFVKRDEKEEIPCNRDYPVCSLVKNFNNKNKPLIEYWGITQKFNLKDNNFIIEDYFFHKLKLKKRRSRKLNQSNRDNIETTKSLLENLNKSIELDAINISKSIDISALAIEENKKQKENLKDLDVNEIDLNDLNEINDVKIKSSVNIDKINLTNLQIKNINLANRSDINLITNYDVIESESSDVDNKKVIDNLKIERCVHICGIENNSSISGISGNIFNSNSISIPDTAFNNSSYFNSDKLVCEENKYFSNEVINANGRKRDSIDNSLDEWGNFKFSPGEGIQMNLLNKFENVKKN